MVFRDIKASQTGTLILDFFKVAANLKNVPRQGWIDRLNHKDPESVAEHAYSAAIMGMILSDMENRDTQKILKMILLHDLSESIIGDIPPDKMSAEAKIQFEDDAMKKILGYLPEHIREKYQLLWDEFQQGSSAESILVHQIDKLEMALQARTYSKSGFTSEQVAPFFDSAREEISEKNIKEILKEILDDV